jgi:hypothetical protein
MIKLKEELKYRFKQNRADEATAKENREIQFEPITQRLDKEEKAIKQADEDLRNKLELILIKKKFESTPLQLIFTSDEDEELSEENIQLIEKGSGTSKGLGGLPRR